ncbi:MAG: hypothetical protein HWD58_11655 [Bacteroidota bacterium]|nr:MAG: hypothetical protein HWD58_11655 [Bacteroidota bacterium]
MHHQIGFWREYRIICGGALDMFDNICEEMLRPLLRELFSNGMGLGSNAAGLTVGTAGGFNQMFDAGAFHGMNGHTDFSLTPERIASYDYCLIQAGVGAVVLQLAISFCWVISLHCIAHCPMTRMPLKKLPPFVSIFMMYFHEPEPTSRSGKPRPASSFREEL